MWPRPTTPLVQSLKNFGAKSLEILWIHDSLIANFTLELYTLKAVGLGSFFMFLLYLFDSFFFKSNHFILHNNYNLNLLPLPANKNESDSFKMVHFS